MTGRIALIATALALVAPASAQHAPQPDAREQSRSVKALSDEDVKQYLAGGGMGYAKAAELNRHPGPMHVLELAEKLQLTADQRARTAALMDTHKSEARALGRKLVEAEQALDQLFASEEPSQSELARRVSAAAVAQGEYRLSHLETHRLMRAILTAEQVAQYDRLRGYGATASHGAHKQH